MAPVVCDSSTLILLAKSGLLAHFIQAYGDVMIPQEVFREVVLEGKKHNKEDALIVENKVKDGKITVLAVEDRKQIGQLLSDFKMQKGEAEAVALCIERKATLLGADDREALKACRVYGIPFVTALAFAIVLATENRMSKEELELAVSKLEKLGFYSKEIMEYARKECGF